MHSYFKKFPKISMWFLSFRCFNWLGHDRWILARESFGRNFGGYFSRKFGWPGDGKGNRSTVRNMRVMEHAIKALCDLDDQAAENKAFNIYTELDTSLGNANELGAFLASLLEIVKVARDKDDNPDVDAHEYVEDVFRALRDKDKTKDGRIRLALRGKHAFEDNPYCDEILAKIIAYVAEHKITIPFLTERARERITSVVSTNQIHMEHGVAAPLLSDTTNSSLRKEAWRFVARDAALRHVAPLEFVTTEEPQTRPSARVTQL